MTRPALILLVLDQSATLSLLERALRAAGYAVSAASGRAMLEKTLNESSPSLMLISENVAGEKGLDIAASVLTRFPTLPIVLFAEKTSPDLLKTVLRAGLSDCIFPPLKTDDIVNAIKHSQQRAEAMGDWVRREIKKSTASLEKRVDELQTLVKLGRDVTSTLDLDTVLTNVATAAAKLTGAEEGNLLLLDRKSGELYVRASYNLDEKTARTLRLPVTDSLAGQVVSTGKPVSIDENSPLKIKTNYLVRTLIYVPLQVQGRVIGVLGVDNRTSPIPFNEHHVLFVSILADYAAIAIENARLYQATETERTKLDTMISNIDDGVIMLDDEHRIIVINPAARKVFGLGLSDLTGQLVLEVLNHPEFRALLESNKENPLKRHEIAFDDGRVYAGQYTRIEGVGWAVTLQDITSLKMLDRVKSDFIHTVSHDLRSPLTAIMGYIELLERVGTLSDQQREFTRRMQQSVQSITLLVNDLLDLGRIEAGFDAGKDVVHLSDVVNYALDNLYNQINEKKIDMQVAVPDDLPALRGNPIRLRQLVDNLIGNAVKYTPANGRVIVNLSGGGDQIILQVKDTGVGIPASDQPHIFEKFYRASNAPKGVPGTGLGLAIVKTIVDSHQGRIWVESTPGQGTTFFVVLPTVKDGYKEPMTMPRPL